jgi:surface polysaccharide O-acyltransferase-like enzyme
MTILDAPFRLSAPPAIDTTIEALVARVPTKAARDVGFDAARVVASLGIVWVHATRSPQTEHVSGAGVFGTAFFTAAAMFFLARGLRREPDREYLDYTANRFRRLIVPFLAWSVIYFVFRNACRALLTHQPTVGITGGSLLTGTEMQLWFLPFLFFAGMLFFPMLKLAVQSDDTRRVVGWTTFWLGAALLALPAPHDESSDRARFMTCAWFVTPSLCFGIAAGLLVRSMDELRSWGFAVAGVGATVCSMAYVCLTGPSIVGKNLGGLGWLAMSLAIKPVKILQRLAKLAPLAFGVYLTHPFVTGTLRSVLLKLGCPSNGLFDISTFALTVPIAFGLSWLIHRSDRTRWLAP